MLNSPYSPGQASPAGSPLSKPFLLWSTALVGTDLADPEARIDGDEIDEEDLYDEEVTELTDEDEDEDEEDEGSGLESSDFSKCFISRPDPHRETSPWRILPR